MTPLAQQYFKQLLLPAHERPDDPMLMPLDDLHCFEVSSLWKPVCDTIDNHTIQQTIMALPGPHILPSPTTWLEFDPYGDGQRHAWLVVELDESWYLFGVTGSLKSWPVVRAIPPIIDGHQWQFMTQDNPKLSTMMTFSMFAEALFMIEILVTPSLVVKVPHDPHAGFARNFRNMPGGYPLHAWHEVLINPDAVKEVSDAQGRISGKKCLHFVHGHRRTLGDGRTVAVKAHWRGDPQIGLMRTKYRSAPIIRATQSIGAKPKKKWRYR